MNKQDTSLRQRCGVMLVWAVVWTAMLQPLMAQEPITYAEWKSRCAETPANRTLQGRLPPRNKLPLPEFRVVSDTAKQLLEQFQQSDLAEESRWLGDAPVASEFFDLQRSYYSRRPIAFQPFAQRLAIPAGSQVILHGDLHGDIRSLMASLDWLNSNGVLDGFQLKQPNTYLLFLGDYVDRGVYGVEVFYTLMRLKLANPDHVCLVRGNHEDFKMTATYGFLREGGTKYGRSFDPLPLWRIYDFLPVVIYLGVGSDYAQCNHGGMEPGFDARPLLTSASDVRYQFLGDLKQQTFMKQHPGWLEDASPDERTMANEKLADFRPESPVLPNPIGFMWNDFFVFAEEPVLGYNTSRLAFNHGAASTKYLLDLASSPQARLRTVFRAHQHSSVPTPAMNRIVASRGIFQHWQASDALRHADADRATLRTLVEQSLQRTIPEGSVWTLNVSPDSIYGHGNQYSFDTFGILRTAKTFDDWRLQVVNIPVAID